MTNFCVFCGAQTNGAAFCPHCGAAQNPGPPAGAGAVRLGIPYPGYSDRVNHPEVLAAAKKNKKAAGIFGLILVPLPVIGFLIYSKVSGDMELSQALIIGGCVSAVFLIFALIGLIRGRAGAGYEGVVVGRETRLVQRHKNSGGDSRRSMITEYITRVQTTDGKSKKIVERDGSQIWAWNYLAQGDRFRYHPQFAFPYERYDKARAPYLACVACGTKNPVVADRCKKCGVPLLK